jgi:hypothetical protein
VSYQCNCPYNFDDARGVYIIDEKLSSPRVQQFCKFCTTADKRLKVKTVMDI